MDEKLINVIVVSYNELLENSNTYKSLKENRLFDDVRFIIADNSTIKTVKDNNREFCSIHSYMYIDMNGNVGLSKAYNKAIKYCLFDGSWIMIADQDSLFSADFICEIKSKINSGKYQVLFPKVVSQLGIMSPFVRRKKGKKYLYGINSGMCYDSRICVDIRYNPNLFMDFVDIDFVNQLIKYGICFAQFNGTVRQSFSACEYSKKKELTRFLIYVRDAIGFKLSWPDEVVYTDFNVFKRTVKLSLKYMSLVFFKHYIKQYLLKSER